MALFGPRNADSAARSSGSSSLISNLTDALNRKQQQLVEQGIVQYADEYSIDFVPAWVGDSVFQKRDVDFSQAPMADSGGYDPGSIYVDPNRITPNTAVFSRQFEAGESIAYIINRVMMESSYVYNQQNIIIDKDGNPQPNGTAAQFFSWYNILCQASPTTQWDSRRKDFVYKIKYYVVPYETPVLSEYFPNGRFRGVHKIYDYWFTGQNNEVVNFEVANNNAYFNIINTPTAGSLVANQVNAQQVVRQNYRMRSQESDQGAAERVNDIAANAADWLYNAVDYASIKIKILGDPAWINAENYTAASDISFAPFRDDGTINWSTGAAYFQFNWNLATDYNLDTGLMEITGAAREQTRDRATPYDPALSFVYTAVECRSVFRKGRFEQELEGRLRLNEKSDNLLRDRSGRLADVAPRRGGGQPSQAAAGARTPTDSGGLLYGGIPVTPGTLNFGTPQTAPAAPYTGSEGAIVPQGPPVPGPGAPAAPRVGRAGQASGFTPGSGGPNPNSSQLGSRDP